MVSAWPTQRMGSSSGWARWSATPSSATVALGGCSGMASGELGEDRFDPLERPIQLVLRDVERRREADRVDVGFLAEELLVAQRLAETARAAGGFGQLEADPKALAAYFLDPLALEAPQLFEEVRAQLGRVVDHLLVDQDFERLARDRGRQRIAAKSRAVVARLVDEHHGVVGEDRRDRVEAAGKRFADD